MPQCFSYLYLIGFFLVLTALPGDFAMAGNRRLDALVESLRLAAPQNNDPELYTGWKVSNPRQSRGFT